MRPNTKNANVGSPYSLILRYINVHVFPFINRFHTFEYTFVHVPLCKCYIRFKNWKFHLERMSSQCHFLSPSNNLTRIYMILKQSC